MSTPTDFDWTNFRIFQGECSVGKEIFGWNSTDFDEWLKKLRSGLQADPSGSSSGIPKDNASDVLALLDRFFPLTDGDKPPSVIVSFESGQLEIRDPLSALGYIFSIARMSQESPPATLTWWNYVVPLLAIFARSVFLVSSTEDAHRPIMCGAMYFGFPRNSNRLVVMLGSSGGSLKENNTAHELTKRELGKCKPLQGR
ncbi:hypothetical protein QBC46DRAFT_426519 [Diplogelasinospora grovesii]|uniref:Uncharacterized protein n=1 Tax=Diplogelasinospora grovesii TaxID=303347 RepID=A0AAN6MWI6_9PEZI|nr:hypothetical protein QBC46DRAFT_426519 [Diplogelasinospora grovesii]